MWQAFLYSIRKRDDARYEYVVLYTDGEQKVLREYNTAVLDDTTIKTTARGEVTRLESVIAQKGELTLSDGMEIDLSPPLPLPPPDPTPEEVERQDWFATCRLHQQQQRLIQLSLLANDDPSLVDVATLKKNMKAEYVESI